MEIAPPTKVNLDFWPSCKNSLWRYLQNKKDFYFSFTFNRV